MTTNEFTNDELLEALDMLWMNIDPMLIADFSNNHHALDAFLRWRNDDGEPS